MQQKVLDPLYDSAASSSSSPMPVSWTSRHSISPKTQAGLDRRYSWKSLQETVRKEMEVKLVSPEEAASEPAKVSEIRASAKTDTLIGDQKSSLSMLISAVFPTFFLFLAKGSARSPVELLCRYMES